MQKEYRIDANKKSLGRVASEAAVFLRGKNNPDFVPNRVPDIKLIVANIDSVKITGKKMEQKEYKNFSGYPGGLKITNMNEIIKKKGIEYVFKHAVRGMLPKNKLRKEMMKNLVIK
jgi:large subunit ribosomal protein L13